MDNKQIAEHWIDSSESDFKTMNILFDNKQFTHSLFWGHLMIEKLFKALYAKQNPSEPHAPKIHNLLTLAKRCDLEINDTVKKQLLTVTDFNLSSRYEDYKKEFYKQCTPEYTKEHIEIIKELRTWLKNLIVR